MNSTTVAVWREVRPQITSEQAREVLAQIDDARACVQDASTWSLAQWASLLAPHDPESARQAILRGLSRWAREQTYARAVLRVLTEIDHRAGVWCLCACAEAIPVPRSALPEEDRAHAAIETARRWVRGTATAEECRRAAGDVSADAPLAVAAYVAAFPSAAAYVAAFPSAAAVAASAGAYAVIAAYADASGTTREYAGQTLCLIAADALLSLPAEDESQSTA